MLKNKPSLCIFLLSVPFSMVTVPCYLLIYRVPAKMWEPNFSDPSTNEIPGSVAHLICVGQNACEFEYQPPTHRGLQKQYFALLS